MNAGERPRRQSTRPPTPLERRVGQVMRGVGSAACNIVPRWLPGTFAPTPLARGPRRFSDRSHPARQANRGTDNRGKSRETRYGSQVQQPEGQAAPAGPRHAEGPVVTGRPSRLALVDGSDSVAEARGGGARHTRAWSLGAPAVVAGCRRLRFRRGVSKVPAVSRAGRSWAVSGPYDVAQQRPMTTNDDGQAYEAIAPEQRKRRSPRSPARPRTRRRQQPAVAFGHGSDV